MVSKHHVKTFSTRLLTATLMGSCLSACAGLTALPLGSTSSSPSTAPVETSELAPLDTPMVEDIFAEDLFSVGPSGIEGEDGEGSQRVPLGSLNSASPQQLAERERTEPTVASSDQYVPSNSSPSNEMMVASTPTSETGEFPIPPEPSPVTVQPQIRLGASEDALVSEPMQQDQENVSFSQTADGTIIISSSNSQTQTVAREFIPASAVPRIAEAESPALGQIPLTPGELNIVRRFETLNRLQEEDLITSQEHLSRRNSNVGALLPYTHDPAAVGLGRSVPSTDAIVARLAALKRAFEMRAITAQQHALERTMILNALLPERPEQRDIPKPPPADVLSGAAAIGHLENFRRSDLITTPEFEAEKAAIEQYLRTGSFPVQSAQVATALVSAATSSREASSETENNSNQIQSQITGPVLHIASFRSEASALRGWDQVLEQNRGILEELQPIIRRIDLGPDQGIFYRLMAGTFNTVADAEAACIRLKQNNQFCRASADGS